MASDKIAGLSAAGPYRKERFHRDPEARGIRAQLRALSKFPGFELNLRSIKTMTAELFEYPPYAMKDREAARYVGVSVSKFRQLVNDGRMPKPRKIDRNSIWCRRDLEDAVDELANADEPNEWDSI